MVGLYSKQLINDPPVLMGNDRDLLGRCKTTRVQFFITLNYNWYTDQIHIFSLIQREGLKFQNIQNTFSGIPSAVVVIQHYLSDT